MCWTFVDRAWLWASTSLSSSLSKEKCSLTRLVMASLSFQITRETLGLSSLSWKLISILKQLVTYKTTTFLHLKTHRPVLIHSSQSLSIRVHLLMIAPSACRRKFLLNLSPAGTYSNVLPTGNTALKSPFPCSTNNKAEKTSLMDSIVLMSRGSRLVQTLLSKQMTLLFSKCH